MLIFNLFRETAFFYMTKMLISADNVQQFQSYITRAKVTGRVTNRCESDIWKYFD